MILDLLQRKGMIGFARAVCRKLDRKRLGFLMSQMSRLDHFAMCLEIVVGINRSAARELCTHVAPSTLAARLERHQDPKSVCRCVASLWTANPRGGREIWKMLDEGALGKKLRPSKSTHES
jgi:hypothetical protein